MVKFNETFSVTPELTVKIKRTIFTERKLEKYDALPINNTAYFDYSYLIRNDPLILPKLYAALTCLTGPGDNYYDDYKGSYSFIFQLDAIKNGLKSRYAYIIFHYRSYIEFSLYHLVPKIAGQDLSAKREPNDELFSNKDICYFSVLFCSYAIGYLKGIQYIPKPFVKSSDSNHLLFGYYNNEYFFNKYENANAYYRKKEKLLKNIGESIVSV